LGEIFEVRLDASPAADGLCDALNQVAPEGLRFLAARRLHATAPGLAKHIDAADFLFGAPAEKDEVDLAERAAAFLALAAAPTPRGPYPRAPAPGLDVIAASAAVRPLVWRQRPLLRARLRVSSEGSVRPAELADLLGLSGADIARLGLVRLVNG